MPGFRVCQGKHKYEELRNIVNNMALTMQVHTAPDDDSDKMIEDDVDRLLRCWPCYRLKLYPQCEDGKCAT